MVKKETKKETLNFFSEVQVLVHPFFALENIRISGRAANVKGLSEKAALIDYEMLKLEKNWKREIAKVKKNPKAIMFIYGLQKGEAINGKEREFFEGALTKDKLAQFSKKYQELLHEAKATLGKRLVYTTHGINEQQPRLAKTLWNRGLLPARNVKIIAYGEYYGSCVKYGRDSMKGFVEAFQKIVFKKGKTSVKSKQIRRKTNQHKVRFVSVEAPNLLTVEALKEFKKKRYVTQKLIQKKSRYKNLPNPKSFSKGLTQGFIKGEKLHQKRRGKK